MTVTEPQHLQLFPTADLPREASLDERFASFIEANPHAVDYFASLARPIAANGRRTGIKALFEFARYNHAAFGDPSSGFALNNSYSSRMARAVVAKFPELADVFQTRELRS